MYRTSYGFQPDQRRVLITIPALVSPKRTALLTILDAYIAKFAALRNSKGILFCRIHRFNFAQIGLSMVYKAL